MLLSTDFYKNVEQARKDELLPEKFVGILCQFYDSYSQALKAHGLKVETYHYLMELLLQRMIDAVTQPYSFEPYHKKITSPFNYYRFGIELIRPLLDPCKSKIFKEENLKKIQAQLNKNENVVLFANHQTEVDPQLMTILLEENYPKIAEDVIFVAGDRVISDPMAIPFSMGCNLLCIYSKKHIENPPEKKHQKQLHNQRTMKLMSRLFKEGGKCIYVAPSGGRDRPNSKGEVEVAFFDPQSIEMFRLMANHSGCPTHFYPLALSTYDILPPPKTVQKELGETRCAKREGARMCFGDEIDMENFPGYDVSDKHRRREALAQCTWELVNKDYQLLLV